jgi:hypothetical protein
MLSPHSANFRCLPFATARGIDFERVHSHSRRAYQPRRLSFLARLKGTSGNSKVAVITEGDYCGSTKTYYLAPDCFIRSVFHTNSHVKLWLHRRNIKRMGSKPNFIHEWYLPHAGHRSILPGICYLGFRSFRLNDIRPFSISLFATRRRCAAAVNDTIEQNMIASQDGMPYHQELHFP